MDIAKSVAASVKKYGERADERAKKGFGGGAKINTTTQFRKNLKDEFNFDSESRNRIEQAFSKLKSPIVRGGSGYKSGINFEVFMEAVTSTNGNISGYDPDDNTFGEKSSESIDFNHYWPVPLGGMDQDDFNAQVAESYTNLMEERIGDPDRMVGILPIMISRKYFQVKLLIILRN